MIHEYAPFLEAIARNRTVLCGDTELSATDALIHIARRINDNIPPQGLDRAGIGAPFYKMTIQALPKRYFFEVKEGDLVMGSYSDSPKAHHTHWEDRIGFKILDQGEL